MSQVAERAGAQPINRVVIVGCGVIAWMLAGIIKKNLNNLDVYLVDDGQPDAGSFSSADVVGGLYSLLGVDAARLVAQSDATFKLGTEFRMDSATEAGFLHSFSEYGESCGVMEFAQYAAVLKQGGALTSLEPYSLGAVAARSAKFTQNISGAVVGTTRLAYGFNAHLSSLKTCLQGYALHLGVVHKNQKILSTARSFSGTISHLRLDTGDDLTGDFFIDCSGGAATLIQEAMGVGYETWHPYLACSTKAEIKLNKVVEQRPLAKINLRTGAWIRQIPLRTGMAIQFRALNEECLSGAMNIHPDLKQAALQEQTQSRFGRRHFFWVNNCLAVGRSACDPDDIAVSEIELAMSAVSQVLKLWPDKEFSQERIDEYNRFMAQIYESVRDYHGLHYYLFSLSKEPQAELLAVNLSEQLSRDIDLFRLTGRLSARDQRMVDHHQWLSLMMGLGLWPVPGVNILRYGVEAEYASYLADIEQNVLQQVAQMPAHTAYIQHCLANIKNAK